MENKALRKMILILICLSFLALCFSISIDSLISLGCRATVSGNKFCSLFAQHYDIDGDTLYFGLSNINRLVIYVLIFSILLLAKKNRSFIYKNKKKTLAWVIVGIVVLDYSYSVFSDKLYESLTSSPYVTREADRWVIDCKKNILYTPYFVYDPNLKNSNKDNLNSFDICLMNYNENRIFNILGKDITKVRGN